jgi:hypothetical protein
LDFDHILSLPILLVNFIIELFLDLHEDSLSLSLSVSGGFNNFLEAVLELAAKGCKVISNLILWVKE